MHVCVRVCTVFICVCVFVCVCVPVGLPDMDGLLLNVVVFQSLLIQEVKEVFNCRRNHRSRTQHTAEEIIHKLLQSTLQHTEDTHTLGHTQ